ncbi:hypothetical protein BKA56DRAFT_611012 [Ilyonectria sp. MPI-CAGE-AT-0026]|nr:hypothetical protein BKA56DRAFT_611012 [Ilyonectria sp. MPI-CAGE-AT-0026]
MKPQLSALLLCVGFLSTLGATQKSATQNLTGAALSSNAVFYNDTLIRMIASPTDVANFTIPATFPKNAQDGDVILVAVDMEISNPNESFDPRSGKAPRSDLKKSQLCQMSVALNNTIVWVGKLLPTFSVLEIDSKKAFNYTDGLEGIYLSVEQKCPSLSAEFLIHDVSLFIQVPVSMVNESDTTTTSELPAVTTNSSANSMQISSLSALISIYGSLAAWWLLTNV